MAPLVQVEALTKQFGGVRALDGLSFDGGGGRVDRDHGAFGIWEDYADQYSWRVGYADFRAGDGGRCGCSAAR